jgi:hypothetical protein
VQYFLDAANDPTITSLYSPWIGFQAMSINKNAGASNGDIGNVWYQASPQVRNAATLGMAISAGNAAVKVRTLARVASLKLTEPSSMGPTMGPLPVEIGLQNLQVDNCVRNLL